MTGTININSIISLSTLTNSGTIALSQNCQSVNLTLTTTESLGYDPLGGLGTDLTCYIKSANPGSGFGSDPIITYEWDTYPATFPGFGGYSGITFTTINNSTPDIGSNSGSFFVGTFTPPDPPYTQNVGITTTLIISTQSTAYPGGTSVLGGIWVSTPGIYMNSPMSPLIWESTYFPQNMPLNCITGIQLNAGNLIPVTFSITGTGYYNEGGVDTGEVLTLNNVTPVYNSVIPLTGFNFGPIASTMQYQEDSSAWTSLTGYTDGVSWSGGGPSATYGTHTIQVRDAITLVESNTVTYVLTAPVDTVYLGLFQTDVVPSETSNYTEFGNAMAWEYQTSLLPDNKELANNAMIYAALDMGFIGPSPTVLIDFYDASDSTVLATTSITPNATNTTWDNFNWDGAPWDGSYVPLAPNFVKWAKPVVFKQGYFAASGTSYQGFSVGAIYMQLQVLGYVQQYNSGVS
jgi:hypothetical protein